MGWESIRNLHCQQPDNYGYLEHFCEIFSLDQCQTYFPMARLDRFLKQKSTYNLALSRKMQYQLDPWLQTGELYRNKKTKQTIVVGHVSIDPLLTVEKLRAILKANQMRAVVFAPEVSWYFPEQTTMIVFMSPKLYDQYANKFGDFSHLYWPV